MLSSYRTSRQSWMLSINCQLVQIKCSSTSDKIMQACIRHTHIRKELHWSPLHLRRPSWFHRHQTRSQHTFSEAAWHKFSWQEWAIIRRPYTVHGYNQAGIQGGRTPPPIFGLAVPNLSPTLHARTPMTPPAPPYFQILDPPLIIMAPVRSLWKYIYKCDYRLHTCWMLHFSSCKKGDKEL